MVRTGSLVDRVASKKLLYQHEVRQKKKHNMLKRLCKQCCLHMCSYMKSSKLHAAVLGAKHVFTKFAQLRDPSPQSPCLFARLGSVLVFQIWMGRPYGYGLLLACSSKR